MWDNKLLLLGVALCLQLANGGLSTRQPSANMELVEAITRVYEHAQQRCRCNMRFFVGYEQPTARYELQDLAQQLLLRVHDDTPRFTSWQHRRVFVPLPHIQIVLVDAWPALLRIFDKELATRNFSYTIIYFAGVHAVKHADIAATLRLLWRLSILNAGIVLRLWPGAELVMVSYFPYRPNSCQQLDAVVVNRYNSRQRNWTSMDFFPEKLRNFHGCKLTCATWEDMPYFAVDRTDADNVRYLGIEGTLLHFMARKLNFSIGVLMLNEQQVEATYNESGWIFEQLFAGDVDYALGAFHYKPWNGKDGSPFSQSLYYFMSHIMLVTRLQRESTAYEKLTGTFRAYTWLAMGAMYACGCIVVHVAHRCGWRGFVVGPRIPWPHYNMFAIMLGVTVHSPYTLPRRNFARFLLCVWLLATLVVRCAYQSGLYRLLRDNSLRHPPQSIADVLAQNFHFGLTPGNERFLISLPEVRPERVFHVNSTELQALRRVASGSSQGRRVAIVTAFEYFGYFRRRSRALSAPLHLVRERIFTQQLTFYVRRQSYLVNVLDEVIMLGHAHGFLSYWVRHYVGAVDDDGYGSVAGDDEQDDDVDATKKAPFMLTMRELSGIFGIYLWLQLAACLVFGIECSLPRLRRLRTAWLRYRAHAAASNDC